MDRSYEQYLLAPIRRQHELILFDPEKPIRTQMIGVDAIVDYGSDLSISIVNAAADEVIKFIQAQTLGLDHVPVEHIQSKGIMLSNCLGDHSSVALAKNAMMFLLMLAHRYPEAMWNFESRRLHDPTGIELEGRTLGIVGFGPSGREFAWRAKPFGLRVMTIDERTIEPKESAR